MQLVKAKALLEQVCEADRNERSMCGFLIRSSFQIRRMSSGGNGMLVSALQSSGDKRKRKKEEVWKEEKR